MPSISGKPSNKFVDAVNRDFISRALRRHHRALHEGKLPQLHESTPDPSAPLLTA